MPRKFRNIVALALFCLFANNLSAQIYFDRISNPLLIKSIQFTQSKNALSYAVLPLLGEEQLNLNFDILENNNRYLAYRLIHCDRNWRKSNLFESDYMNVSGELTIDDYENSFVTKVSYVHYSISFPNENLRLLLSGNYVIQVFDTETDEILIQKRFVVSEQMVELQASVQRPSVVQFADEYQQLLLKIVPHGFNLSSFDKDLHVVYRQNGRWDKTLAGIQPSHISGDGVLVFNDNRNSLILSGAEFRQFDFKNFNYASYPVDYFVQENGVYLAFLEPDKVQPAYIYNDKGDLNGKFLAAISTNFPAETSADYAWVKFTLPYHQNAYDTLNLYVCGGFNNWAMNAENRMTYNHEKHQYETSILLKQGYYGYTYIFASNDFNTLNHNEIDGSFYQTENDYEIFVYFYDYKNGYDRCIAYKLINSRTTDDN